MSKGLLLKYTTFLLAVLSGCSTQAFAILNSDEIEERPVYIINPSDQLLITVAGYEKELTTLVVVRPDGMVTYPMVGDVEAAGLTISQLSSAISKRLSALGYYESPQVTVQLRVPSREIVYIFGDVRDPGQKGFQVSVNVVEALAAAGGFRETADLANARIIKNRKEVVPVDLSKLLEKDIIDQGVFSDELLSDRLMLENGDVFIIPSAIKHERVNIIGYVHQSGQYPVKSAVSLIEALALAGGPLEMTADLRHIRIIRKDGSVVIADVTRSWADADTAPVRRSSCDAKPKHKDSRSTERRDPVYQEMVQPGDSVFVPGKENINILGNVKSQGQFTVDGEISILKALALAGIEKDSNLEKLVIVRSSGEHITFDASKILKQQGQEVAAWRLGPGDTLIVSSSWRINWNAVSTIVLLFSTLYAIFR